MANAKSNLTQTNIAFKKISGKATVNLAFTETTEPIGSAVQLDTSLIFGQQPPNLDAHLSMYGQDPNNIVERVEIEFVQLNNSIYSNTGVDDGAESFDSLPHAYAARLKPNGATSYDTFSTNPNAGSAPFLNGAFATGSNQLQFVPGNYGAFYIPTLLDSDGDVITSTSDIDWYFDAFSGILFVQDPDTTIAPASGSAYLYIGTFASQSETIPIDTLQSVTTAGHQTSQSISISGAAGAETLLVSGGLVDFSDSTNTITSLLTASNLQVIHRQGDLGALPEI